MKKKVKTKQVKKHENYITLTRLSLHAGQPTVIVSK